ncbi:MAG: O-antigen ligase family protein, partial [Candidatus Moraniibacteriota bacterium]
LTYDGRLAAWYLSPNYLAFFLAPGTLLAHHFYFHPFGARMKTFRHVFLLAFVVFMVVLFFTRSYATWVGLVVAGLAFLFLDMPESATRWKKSAALFLLVTVFSALLLLESGSPKWQALTSLQERSSLASREMIWRVAVKIISDHPVLGIGLGRFQEVYLSYQQYFPPYLEWAVPQPHNLYLAVWLQTGLLGLLGFTLFIVAWLRKMLALRRSEGENGGRRNLSALLVALLVLYLVFGLVDTPFFKTDSAFAFWFLIAFGAGLMNQEKSLR